MQLTPPSAVQRRRLLTHKLPSTATAIILIELTQMGIDEIKPHALYAVYILYR